MSNHAWAEQQGLSKMSRNHIHLAQGIAVSGVISGAFHPCRRNHHPLIPRTKGMRKSSQIFIFVNVQKAIDAGIKFYLSANGVVLTEGDERGFLSPEFFSRVETADRKPLPGFDGPEGVTPNPSKIIHAETGVDAASVSQTVGLDKHEEAIQTAVEVLGQKVENTTL